MHRMHQKTFPNEYSPSHHHPLLEDSGTMLIVLKLKSFRRYNTCDTHTRSLTLRSRNMYYDGCSNATRTTCASDEYTALQYVRVAGGCCLQFSFTKHEVNVWNRQAVFKKIAYLCKKNKTKQKARMTTIFVAGMLCLRNASITVDKTRYVGYKVALHIFTYVLVDFRMSSFHWGSLPACHVPVHHTWIKEIR